MLFIEDIGEGDHTSLSCIPASARGKSMLLIKEAGVVAGVRVALEVFRLFDPQLQTTVFIQDGQKVKPGDIVFETAGSVRSLLQTERLMLNIMQRMSGIATRTRLYADRLQGLHTRRSTHAKPPRHAPARKGSRSTGRRQQPSHGLLRYDFAQRQSRRFCRRIAKAMQPPGVICRKKLNLKIEIEVRSWTNWSRCFNAEEWTASCSTISIPPPPARP